MYTANYLVVIAIVLIIAKVLIDKHVSPLDFEITASMSNSLQITGTASHIGGSCRSLRVFDGQC